MSTMDDEDLLPTIIKLEHDEDEDLTSVKSLEVQSNKDYYSTQSSIVTPSLSSTYKGKIEVTSKGRRKIFDGVRWQILCRRPECPKQTNKKSLCITHYKEEYEFNTESSWSSNDQSFQALSYQQQHSFDEATNRSEIEDQNNTISTTNIIDNDEQLSFNTNNNNRLVYEGQIKVMHNDRRYILKNRKWQPLCRYDNNCRNMAKYEYLCIKHFEINQQKRRNTLKFHNNNNHRRPQNHRSTFSNEIIKPLKNNNDFQITSSAITEQFDINSNENSYMSTDPTNGDSSSIISKLPGRDVPISSKKNVNSDHSSFNNQKPELKKVQQNDQSVQTDLTIALCCIIHHEDHSLFSSCKNKKTTSSILSCNTKHEPQYYDTRFST